MKKTVRRHKIALAVLLLCSTVGLEMAQGHSALAPDGYTGAPGHLNCMECHTNSGSGSGGVSLDFSGGSAYDLGQIYSVKVTVTDPTNFRFGFSMVARDFDNDLVDVGTWSVLNSSDTVVNGPSDSHASHKSAPFGGGSYIFEMQWTAPTTSVGDVTFYVAANAADNSHSSFGDHIYVGSLTIAGPAGPNEPPVLSDLLRLNEGSSQFTLTGVANLVYIVEYGDDLKVWNLLKEVTLNSSAETVTDNSTLNVPFRVYRAREKVEP
jgi:hypothetical protein